MNLSDENHGELGKSLACRFYRFPRGLPLLLIAGLIHWRLGWLKGINKNWLPLWVPCVTTASSTTKSDPYRPDPCAAGVPDYSRVGLILLTMQLNISELLWSFIKNWRFSGWCLACAGRYWRKRRCRASLWYAGTADQPLASAIVRISLALLPIHFWSVVAELPRCI